MKENKNNEDAAWCNTCYKIVCEIRGSKKISVTKGLGEI